MAITTGRIALPRARCEHCNGNLRFQSDEAHTIHRRCIQCGRAAGEWLLPVLPKPFLKDRTLAYRIQQARIMIELGHSRPTVLTALRIPHRAAQRFLSDQPPQRIAPRRRLEAAEESEIVKKLDAGANHRTLAKEYGCTQAAIRRLFPRTATRNPRPPQLTLDQIQAIKELKQDGTSTRELEEQFQVSGDTIRYYTSPPSSRISPELIQQANALLAQGVRPSQVSRQLNFSRQCIYRFCQWRTTHEPASQ